MLLQNWALEKYMFDILQSFTASATAQVSVLMNVVTEIVQVGVSWAKVMQTCGNLSDGREVPLVSSGVGPDLNCCL